MSFLPILSFFFAGFAIRSNKSSFWKVVSAKFNQKYKKHLETFHLQIKFIETRWTHCGDRLVANGLSNSYFSI